MITLVLAGTRHQFEDWCREQDVNPRDRSVARYVWRQDDVRGITQQELHMVVYGTFWQRRDAQMLYDWTKLAVDRSRELRP